MTMRTIGLEEHFVSADVLAAWRALDLQWQDVALKPSGEGESGRRLLELGLERFAAIEGAGIDVQVLSLTAPGVQNLAPADAVALQVASNDRLAETVRAQPGRLQGLATLATPAPAKAARELERAVTTLGLNGAMLFGRTRERNLDHPDFWPIFEAAAALNAPLYLHPQSPLPAVRAALYVSIAPAPSGKALRPMLEAGEIDAFISALVPDCVLNSSLDVARLFPDYKAVERDYYRRTGIFPIMHTVVVRKTLLMQHPHLAKALYQGFCDSKDMAMERNRKGRLEQHVNLMVPWFNSLFEENGAVLPEDWWPYGVAANRRTIDTYLRYFFEQGLSKRQMTCDEIFDPDLLDI